MKGARAIFLCAGLAWSQVAWIDAPRHLRLYGRAEGKDTGAVIFSGTVHRAETPYTEIRLEVSRNDTLQSTLRRVLSYQGDSAGFSISLGIRAELANYGFEVSGHDSAKDSILLKADSVVAGDVIVIQGQSNAEACMYSGSANANQSPFIRVFGNGAQTLPQDSVWHVGDGDVCAGGVGGTGQWGLRLARDIVDSAKIPVAIFNGGEGGQPISVFQPNLSQHSDPATNYGRMLSRLQRSGSVPHLHALVWHQGEANGNLGTTTASYKSAFISLRSQWLADFPALRRIYLFQIRNGCDFPETKIAAIKEAHRQLANELDSVEIMSTSGQSHYADCHYPYENGYRAFGDNIFRLIDRDFHGRASLDDIEPPQVKFAEVTGAKQISLIMANVFDGLTWVGGADSEFVFTGTTAEFASGSVSGSRVNLSLSAAAGNVSAIGYLGHEDSADPLVVNRNGIGMVHFTGFPITAPWYRDSVSVAAILKANSLGASVASVATRSSGGRATALNLHARGVLVLPGAVVYMDSLKTLDLGSDSLSSLPREITKLPSGISVNLDSNALCQLSDSIVDWVAKHASDKAWKSTQKCRTTEIRQENQRTDIVRWELRNRSLLLRFSSEERSVNLEIRRADGRREYAYQGEAGDLRIEAAGWARGIHLLRVRTSDKTQVVRLSLF